MSNQPLHVVTGAFGLSGKYIAKELLGRGLRVRTLTNRKNPPDIFRGAVDVHPLAFGDHRRLVQSLKGATVLYNTYWVRFNYKNFNFSDAVQNTLKLFEAAEDAGIERVVHVSITNPSQDSNLEYFRGKALLESALKRRGMSDCILRPAVLFGDEPDESILINNIAWILRRLPVVGVFGDGSYRLQPIYVRDLARIAVDQGSRGENTTIEAIGPQTFTYKNLMKTIGEIIGVSRPIISVSPRLGYRVGSLIGKLVGDVFITRDEITGLMNDLLYVNAPPAGATPLTQWARRHAATLGRAYASELARRRQS
jgi:uncharacterized protein YbjT (DUF2867 family)